MLTTTKALQNECTLEYQYQEDMEFLYDTLSLTQMLCKFETEALKKSLNTESLLFHRVERKTLEKAQRERRRMISSKIDQRMEKFADDIREARNATS